MTPSAPLRALVLAPLLALAALAGAPPSAAAQLRGGGADLHLFRPAVDSKGLLTIDGTDILGHLDPSFGLVLDWGHGLLRDPALTAGDAPRLVDDSFTGTFHVDLGLANLVVVGIQLPVHVIDGPAGVGTEAYASPAQGLSVQQLGDIVLHAKLRLLRSDRSPIGLAAILSVALPTGDASTFAGDPSGAIWPRLAVEWAPSRRFRVDANLGYRLVLGDGARLSFCDAGPTACTSGGASHVTYGDAITFGLGASVRVAPAVDVVLEGYGHQLVGDFGQARALPFELVGGLKVFVERNSYLLIGGGTGLLSRGYDAADARAFLGFVFEPSIGDRDGDGLRDDIDHCPDQPEDQDDFEDEDGCPDPDNDRDGILDDDDDCVLVPEDHDGDRDEDGCPEGNEGDRDGDGLLDSVDRCPDDPEDRDGFEDQDGCPDPDNDRDGVLDTDDLCPDEPEDRDGFEDDNGCPDPDNDQDHILDVTDECDNEPEIYNNVEDEDGCPDRGIVDMSGTDLIVLREIHFATDSAQILPDSYDILDAITAALLGNPQVTLIEIQGHADERATDEYNIRLTRDRAAAVREALVQRGVEANRLRSAGYGERCPLDPRHVEAAWRRNRRVEFKILQVDGRSTEVEIVCAAGRELAPE